MEPIILVNLYAFPFYHAYCLAKYIYYTIMLNIDNINYEYVDNLYYLYELTFLRTMSIISLNFSSCMTYVIVIV